MNALRKLYVAREDATAVDLEHVLLGVYTTPEEAIEICNAQIETWLQTCHHCTSLSGWIDWQELLFGGQCHETCIDPDMEGGNTIFHYVQEVEVDQD